MENKEKSMVDFLKKLNEDQALAERMSKSENPEAAYEIAKENGVTASIDEFKATMKVLAAVAKGELSEEEMKAVAGGGVVDDLVGGLAIGAALGVGAVISGVAIGTIGIGLAAVAAA